MTTPAAHGIADNHSLIAVPRHFHPIECPPCAACRAQAINVTALALDLARFLRQPAAGGGADQAAAPAAPPAKERRK